MLKTYIFPFQWFFLIQHLATLIAQAVMNPARTYRAKAENPSFYKASQWSQIARRVLEGFYLSQKDDDENTDDGIRRATIEERRLCISRAARVSIPMTVFGGLQLSIWQRTVIRWRRFNTDDGIWRATIRLSKMRCIGPESFNTDDGIWRATIKAVVNDALGYAEFQYRWRYLEGYNLD